MEPDVLQEEMMLLEKVLPTTKDKVKRSGLKFLQTPEYTGSSNGANTGTLFDFSELDGLSYFKFKKKFFELAKDMETYQTKILLIPIDFWANKKSTDTPVDNLLKMLDLDLADMKKACGDFTIIFYSGNLWFALNIDMYQKTDKATLMSNINMLKENNVKSSAVAGNVSGKSGDKQEKTITSKDIDKEKEVSQKNIKTQVVANIANAAELAKDADDALNQIDDAQVVNLLDTLSDEEYGKPKFSSARATRMGKIQDQFSSNEGTTGHTVKDLINNPESKKELPAEDMKIASINEEWEHVQFTNFNKVYEIDDDIRLILYSFGDKNTKSYPINCLGIEVEDTSTSEDYIYTYRCKMEDSSGKQFTIVFDIPKFRNGRFMRLRGNDKVISGQLFNLPCTKTSPDTVQVVSNYRKIMISRFGGTGKSYPVVDRLIKSINKYSGTGIKVSLGDNRRTCSKYELPVDYIDLAMNYNWIETANYKFYFDQDFYRKNYTIEPNSIPICIYKESNSVIYYDESLGDGNISIAEQIAEIMLSDCKGLKEVYDTQKPATKHTYSRASIMAADIPLIVVICNSIPFTEMLKRANINYVFSEKRVKYDPDKQGCIKFADGFLLYDITYASSMLMNGLYDCNTEIYNFLDMNKKSTWLDFLDNFGGRIKADGLDNFKEVFMDPITCEVCRECKIPDDYIDILIYANSLLSDNKYIKHTDLASNRYRTTEIVAGHLYQVLAAEYIKYYQQAKKGRKVSSFSIKRTAVIDSIFTNPVMSDLSSMSPLLEQEANNSATFKGLSGLNSDRAYSLDKRTYDESMVGKLALSTGFASNVGINRQTTMDMDIQGKRGYIKNTPNDEKSVTKRLSITEAVTPFGSTRDDPFRTAMTYIQTSKHSMPTNKSMPLLVTNGADEALVKMVSDNYVIRAEDNGEVVEYVPDDHMVIKYTNGEGRWISLKYETRKNSDGGFYITIRFKTDFKKTGLKFKKDDILAYDERSFSNRNGEVDDLAYDVGVLAYTAIMATDEGFEDSTSISRWLSEALGSEVVAEDSIELGVGTNIYDIVKEGQEVKEGDPLIIFQNNFDEEDANILLKNITDTDFVSDLGRIRVKAKYSGIVQEIKIYRTCEVSELSDSLKKLVNDYDKNIAKKKAAYKKYNIPGANMLDPDYKMPPTGKLKDTDGVRIEFYIKYFDNMGVGDKLVAQSANKGVARSIFPLGDEPYSSFDTTKTIHAVFSSRSFNARMVTSPIVSGAINKGLVNLDEQVKKIMGLPLQRLEDIQG